MFTWSWFAFIVGNMSGVVITMLILGVFALGARNDEVQPSVEKKPEKRRDVH